MDGNDRMEYDYCDTRPSITREYGMSKMNKMGQERKEGKKAQKHRSAYVIKIRGP